MEKRKATGICLAITGVLLFVILLPICFSYVDYYDYGLVQRKSTGSVDTALVYSNGRYFIGPDKHFIKYQADAHLEQLNQLGVFSTSASNVSVGLEFEVDVDFTFFLNKDEIGLVHREQASNYERVIMSRAEEALKNSAAKQVGFSDFFQERKRVEAVFRAAIEERWNSPPSLHCKMDQFHLGRVRIPDSVAEKQLQSRVQNERNGREQYLQEAQIEREMTTVEVNKIDLETQRALRTARAKASLVRTKALAEAQLIRAQAGINGTRLLLEAVGIDSQEHVTTYGYIKTLRDRTQLNLAVSYLSENSVLRTAAA